MPTMVSFEAACAPGLRTDQGFVLCTMSLPGWPGVLATAVLATDCYVACDW